MALGKANAATVVTKKKSLRAHPERDTASVVAALTPQGDASFARPTVAARPIAATLATSDLDAIGVNAVTAANPASHATRLRRSVVFFATNQTGAAIRPSRAIWACTSAALQQP